VSGVKNFFSKIDWGLVVVALLTLFIIQNFLQAGAPSVADFQVHLYRTLEYKNAWAPGVIVPRWAPNLAFGYGYPLFVFTPPLPHLLILAFYGLGFSLVVSLKAIFIVAVLLYAVGMYLLARDTLGSPAAGLVAGVTYAFAPFALREALLYGGNIPQFLAIALFPWTLWAMTRSAYRRSVGWMVWAAIFYAGVMMSHLFQVVIFTPVVVVYGILLFWLAVRGRRAEDDNSASRRNRVVTSMLPLLAVPLGLLLSAFFWLPAFTERFYTSAQADIYLAKSPFYIRYPYLSELIAWIYPLDARAANPYVPLTLGVITLVLAGLGLIARITLAVKKRSAAQKESPVSPLCSPIWFIAFFALLAAIAIFLILPVSRLVWDRVPLLQLAQFPWRLFSLANLGLAFLAGSALLLPPAKWRMPSAAVCVVVQLVAVAPFLYPVVPFTQYGNTTLADQINYELRSQAVGATTLSEYLPATVDQPPTTSPLVPAFQAGKNPQRLDRASLPAGATVTLLQQDAITHRYQFDTPTAFAARLFQYHYPGWQAWLDDQPVDIRPEPGTGLIVIDIPPGEHILTVRFGETPDRVVAMLLSGVTIVGLVVVGVYFKRKGAAAQRRKEDISVSRFPSSPVLIALVVLGIIVAALWLKPLLRPVFTVDSPPGRVLPAQNQTDIHFANGIRLAGYDLPKTVVSSGERLPVVLYWETDSAPINANLQPFVHLDRLGDWVTVADSTNYTPGDVTTESVLPTFHWDTSRYVRDEHDLIVPNNTPPQAYALRVGFFDPDSGQLLPLVDGSDTAQLTVVNVSPTGREPTLGQSFDVSFRGDGDSIDLTGFQLDSLTPEHLDFTLAWRSEDRPQKDYTVFAQLLDSDQNLVAGFDRPPLDGTYPTSTWLPGQTIIDPRTIPLANVSPGKYRLIVGLYNPVTQQRLLTGSGTDFVELTTVTLEP